MRQKEKIAIMLLTVLVLMGALLSGCRQEQPKAEKTAALTDPAIEESIETLTESSSKPIPTSIPSPTPAVDLSHFAIAPQFDDASEFNEYGFASVSIGAINGVDGENFFINEKGEITSNPVYGIDEYQQYGFDLPPLYGLDLFSDGDLFGYVNEKNEVVIAPQYKGAQPFAKNGLAGVMVDGKWGYINETNEMVIEPQYDDVSVFFESGYAGVSIDGKFALINSTGQIIRKTEYEYAGVSSTYTVEDTKFGEPSNCNGLVQKSIYEDFGLLRFYDQNTNQCGLMNTLGEVILAPDYTNIFLPCEFIGEGPGWGDHGTGFIMVEKEEYMYGLVSQTGEIIMEPFESYGIPFGEKELAVVMIDGKFGYINTDGEIVIEPKYEHAGLFAANGLAYVCENSDGGKYGYIDTHGKYVIDVQFDRVDDFCPLGVAWARQGDKTGLINEEGEFVFDSTGGSIDLYSGVFGNELIQVIYEDKTVYVNSSGETVKEMPAGTYWFFPEYDTYLIQVDGKIGMIDPEGNYVLELQYSEVYGDWNTSNWEGASLVNHSTVDLLLTYDQSSGGKYGIITCDGKEILPTMCDSISTVSTNGMIPVCVNGKYGYCKVET